MLGSGHHSVRGVGPPLEPRGARARGGVGRPGGRGRAAPVGEGTQHHGAYHFLILFEFSVNFNPGLKELRKFSSESVRIPIKY